MPPIRGFESASERIDHFDKHVIKGHEFTFADEIEYEKAAIEFMNKVVDGMIIEQDIRASDNTIIRFDRGTNEICFVHANGHIGTYYKIKKKDSYAYFKKRCKG